MATKIADLTALQAAQPAPQATFHAPATFDPDAWHAMQARDVQLIEDQVLHGRASREYVYEFEIGGKKVRGISVVGARELASTYGGIKARIVASVDKTGDLFVFKSFEPLQIQANLIPQLADQEDFYEVVIEVQDLKSGNAIQVRKKETKVERKRDGSKYERPHYDVIAESKAFRNAVLAILPQGVLAEFEARCLKAGNVGAEKTLAQLQAMCLRYAGKHGFAIDRTALQQLTYEQVRGLEDAAADGKDVFAAAAMRIGVLDQAMTGAAQEQAKEKQADPKPASAQAESTQPVSGASGGMDLE